METPPYSSVRRLGRGPGGASLIPPPEVCDRQGVFSAWCPASALWGIFPRAAGRVRRRPQDCCCLPYDL
jgi:hypothetical protein